MRTNEVSSKVVCDSVSPLGVRLTTLEVTFPRFVLAEFNTHRMFSRNSASSRAIPVEKTLARVKDSPAGPIEWGANNPGMQSKSLLGINEAERAEEVWTEASEAAIEYAERLMCLGVHKQIANRLLEPFMWHTVLVTATDWDNFWNLRISPMAQPEIRLAAMAMKEALDASLPTRVPFGTWHLPLISPEDYVAGYDFNDLVEISVARCARVSYLTHDGVRDPQKDLELYHKLATSGHWSPFEHVATPAYEDKKYYGNFHGWIQYRKLQENPKLYSALNLV